MKRILIIEDNLEIAELERDFLEASAIESVIETDGTKGLERALQENFDLILLDIMLPGTDSSSASGASTPKATRRQSWSTSTVSAKKIEPDPAKPIYIETVWGAGYRFKE